MIPHRLQPDAAELVCAIGQTFRDEWRAWRNGLLLIRERQDVDRDHLGATGLAVPSPSEVARVDRIVEARSTWSTVTPFALLDLEESFPPRGKPAPKGLFDGQPVRPRQCERLLGPDENMEDLGAGARDIADALFAPTPPRWIELGDIRSPGEARLWLGWIEELEQVRGLPPTPIRLRLDAAGLGGSEKDLHDILGARLCGIVFQPEAYLAGTLRSGAEPHTSTLEQGAALAQSLGAESSAVSVIQTRMVPRDPWAASFERQSCSTQESSGGCEAIALHQALAGQCAGEGSFASAIHGAISDVHAALSGRPMGGLAVAELVGRLAFWAVDARPRMRGEAGRLSLPRIEQLIRRSASDLDAKPAGELFAWFATAPDPQPALAQAIDLAQR